jgi:hypothetical protein
MGCTRCTQDLWMSATSPMLACVLATRLTNRGEDCAATSIYRAMLGHVQRQVPMHMPLDRE